MKQRSTAMRAQFAALDELLKNGVDVGEASRKLSAVIPQAMSMPFCQAWGEGLRHGALWDLLGKVEDAAVDDFTVTEDEKSDQRRERHASTGDGVAPKTPKPDTSKRRLNRKKPSFTIPAEE